MTIDEARAHVGDGVLYRPRCGHTEEGVITRVRGTWVFVKYESSPAAAQATDAADLELLAGKAPTDG